MVSGVRRVSIFGTHRGRKVRNLALVAFALSILVLFINNAAGGGGTSNEAGTSSSNQDGFGSQPSKRDPKVAHTVSNAFSPQGSVDPAEADPANADTYQALADTAAATATAYGTFSYQQAPKQFVTSVPHLAPAAKTTMLAQATATWPGLVRNQVSSVSGASRTEPQIVDFNAEAGTARVTVTVSRSVTTGASTVSATQSYFVELTGPPSLNGMPQEDAGAQWLVVGIISV